MRRLVVDWENNADEWWEAAHKDVAHCPKGAQPLLDIGGPDEVTVSDDEAGAFLDWATALPGWDDPKAPYYAKAPILVYTVGEPS